MGLVYALTDYLTNNNIIKSAANVSQLQNSMNSNIKPLSIEKLIPAN